MPRLTVYFVRSSFLFLVAGFTLGAMLLVYKVAPLHPFLWWVRSSHIDFLLFGWTLQLAMGVAFWILPRSGGGYRPRAFLAWWAFFLLNVGVLAAGIGTWFPLSPSVHLAGRIAEFSAVGLFMMHAVPRIKSFGTS